MNTPCLVIPQLMLSPIQVSFILGWISLGCSAFLSLIYWKLGYRFRLLAFLSINFALQHSQKIWLLTTKAILKPEYYQPTFYSSIAILVNSFAVAAYNLSLVAICIHIYLLIQAAGTGYDHINAQIRFIQGISVLSCFQLIHVLLCCQPSLTRIAVLPYLWIQNGILVLQVTVCPVLIVHLLIKCYRTRERTFEFLRKSSISSSLMWRLMAALIGVAVLSSFSIYLQVTSSVKTGTGGSFKPFHMWNATADQLAYRYQIGCIVGPIVMLILLTAQEPKDYIRERYLDFVASICGRRTRRKSSIPWLDQENAVRFDNSSYAGRDSMDTQMNQRPGCFGSVQSDPSSLDPKDTSRLESFDITLPGQLRRNSEVPRPDTPAKPNRTVSLAQDIKGGRSDSLPEIVVIKSKESF